MTYYVPHILLSIWRGRVVELLLSMCQLIVYVIRAHIGAYAMPVHNDVLPHSALLCSKEYGMVL